MTTGLVPDGPGGVEIAFDLIDHAVVACATDGRSGRFALGPTTVAGFHTRFMELLAWLRAAPRLDGRPNEVPDPVPVRW